MSQLVVDGVGTTPFALFATGRCRVLVVHAGVADCNGRALQVVIWCALQQRFGVPRAPQHAHICWARRCGKEVCIRSHLDGASWDHTLICPQLWNGWDAVGWQGTCDCQTHILYRSSIGLLPLMIHVVCRELGFNQVCRSVQFCILLKVRQRTPRHAFMTPVLFSWLGPV